MSRRASPDSQIAMARREVATARRHVEGQESALERLRAAGDDVAMAEHLLGVFRKSLDERTAHLQALEERLAAPAKGRRRRKTAGREAAP